MFRIDILSVVSDVLCVAFPRLMCVMKVTSAETRVEVAVKYFYLLACKPQEAWLLTAAWLLTKSCKDTEACATLQGLNFQLSLSQNVFKNSY